MILVSTEQRSSHPFNIDLGKQVTLLAYGLQNEDYAIVEIVGTTLAAPASGDPCCPGQVALPEISSMVPLRCRNGARVILTKEHPYATLASPQGVQLQVRVVADDDAVITVHKNESDSNGCMDCVCEEPFCASYPMIDGGFGFVAGDIKDPEATVVLAPCPGDVITPSIYLFPTPRPGATAVQKDCAGNIIGYAMNSSSCAIVLNSIGSC